MQQLTLKHNAARLAICAACVAVFLTALDQTVVVTALPQIITDLTISPLHLDQAAWIVSGYLLGYVVVMPLMGRISDLYGRRRILIISLLIFALGSLLCALSVPLSSMYDISFLQNIGIDISTPGLIWLVAARFIQAVGGGAVVPIAMAIVGDFYNDRRRAFMLGLIGMVTEAGGVLGPLYGSLIVQSWGWQYIFYFNLPIVAVLIVLLFFLLPGRSVQKVKAEQKKGQIDLAGAFLLGAALICMSLGLSQEAAQITPQTLTATTPATQNNPWLLAAALILFICFIGLEFYLGRRSRGPIIELALFKNLAFSSAALVSFCVGTALIIAMVDIPIFFLTVLNRQGIESGLALLRLTAMIPVGAVSGGWLVNRIGARWVAMIGLVTTALGFWLMHLWPIDVNDLQVTTSTIIGGLGLGLVIAPISTTAINAVKSNEFGIASAVVTMMRMIGMILGLAALTSWGLGRFRGLIAAFKTPAGVQPLSPQYNAALGHYITISAHEIYTSIFLAAGVLCLLALLPAFLLEEHKPVAKLVRRKHDGITKKTESSRIEEDVEQESEADRKNGQREREFS